MVSLVSPGSQCNTSKLRHNRNRNRSRSWCFTWNNYTTENWSQLSHPNFFKTEINKLIFQEEIGKENTKHLQGFVQFKNQIDFNKLKKLLPKCHIEKCKHISSSIRYCSKNESKNGERFTYGINDSELYKEPTPLLLPEEILADLCRQEKEDIDKDANGFWKENEIDF